VTKVLAIVGAGPGLGASMAKRFAASRWAVGLVARREEVVNACVSDLGGYGVPTHGLVADVVNARSVDASLDAIRDALGVPTVVAYNASLYQPEPALELTPEKLMLGLNVHVAGALNTAQSAVRILKPTARGVLVFTVNKLAREPAAGATAMSIGKGAQLNLALSLEQELQGTGIHIAIVTICGPIKQGTQFDPDRIAEVYWDIANQDPRRWQRDFVFDAE
jgi:NAD(P)-dependent dehydrogenase (short-subunit alcohol dehydrogenase family)